jgi:pimeloyl-ACP methyl ester carboxylesterase
MRLLRSHESFCLVGVALLAACTLESSDEHADDVALYQAGLVLNRDCSDRFEDVYAQPKNLPRYNPSRRGDIVRCAQDRTIGKDEIASSLARRGFVDVTAQYAVQVLRIMYRTERLANQGDVSSAIVLLPTAVGRFNGEGDANLSATQSIDSQSARALTPDAVSDDAFARGGGRRAPLVVFGHGTVPYGNKCAYSRNDPTSDPFPPVDTEQGSLLAFATRGYPVIMPDYAGFVAGSKTAGYLLSEDEAHSLLDSTRAMQKLVRHPHDRVVLVGHSQGGHAILSAQALARSYGLAGQLSGVAAMAPFWAPGRTFGAIVSPEYMFNTADNPGELSSAIEYFYTHAEVYDGRGKGANLFKPEKRAALQGLVSTCAFPPDPSTDPGVLGLYPSDFFEPNFLEAVSLCGIVGGDACASGIGGTWETRFRADRPKLDRNGAPVLMWQGALDAVIPTPFAKCAIDKIAADLPANGGSAKFTLCGDADADHETLLPRNVAWVTRWIDARTLGAAEPPVCPGESALGGPLMCPEPPGNVD